MGMRMGMTDWEGEGYHSRTPLVRISHTARKYIPRGANEGVAYSRERDVSTPGEQELFAEPIRRFGGVMSSLAGARQNYFAAQLDSQTARFCEWYTAWDINQSAVPASYTVLPKTCIFAICKTGRSKSVGVCSC